MGTVVTVMNMKGGVGKTTVTMHIAGVMAHYRIRDRYRRVLAIDYDPQFNLSQAFIAAKAYYELERQRKTCLSVLLDDETNLNAYQVQVPGNHEPPAVQDLVYNVYSTKTCALDILPSTLDLMYVALGQSEKRLLPLEERFEKFIEACRAIYDIVFIDCHPAGSILTKTSLQNSDHVLIPVSPQRYAVRGIGLMMKFINAKKVGASSPMPHILFNAVPRYGKTTEEQEIRSNPRFTEYCMSATMKRYKAFTEPLDGRGFCWSSGKAYSSEATYNLIHIAGEFIDRTTAR